MRKLALLLAVLLVMTMTGCNVQAAEDTQSVEVVLVKDKISGVSTPKPTIKPTQMPENDFRCGEVSGSVYENGFIGIGCELSDDWIFYSPEEIMQVNGITADLVEDQALKEMLESGKAIVDMYAASSDGMMNMNVSFENYGSMPDIEKYIEEAAGQMPKALEAMGMENISSSVETVEFAGKLHHAIRIYAEIETIPIHELLVCIEDGQYICMVTLGSFLEDHTLDMAKLFYSLEN